MKPGYTLSMAAEHDLLGIEDYSASNWGDAQAARYIRALYQGFDRLGKKPALGRPRADVPAPYLAYPVREHLVIYRVRKGVEIISILHQAMDAGPRIEEAVRRDRVQTRH